MVSANADDFSFSAAAAAPTFFLPVAVLDDDDELDRVAVRPPRGLFFFRAGFEAPPRGTSSIDKDRDESCVVCLVKNDKGCNGLLTVE